MIAVPHYISAEEYLSIERRSNVRHEYRYGLVYAMAGGTDNHDRIAYNMLKTIDNHLGDRSECRFYSGNVKVNYADDVFYYPDAFVTCDPRDREDRYVKRYPKLIVEVLSSSTKAFDADEKFEDYKKIDALEEYVLISQDKPYVQCYRRQSDGTWKATVYERNEQVYLESIELRFDILELYRGLD